MTYGVKGFGCLIALTASLWAASAPVFAADASPTPAQVQPTATPAPYDPNHVSDPPYDLTPWQNRRIDISGGVSPYVVVVANELARSSQGLPYAPKDLVEVGVVAVYQAYLRELAPVARGGGVPPATQFSLPEPRDSDLASAVQQLAAAGLPIDNSRWN